MENCCILITITFDILRVFLLLLFIGAGSAPSYAPKGRNKRKPKASLPNLGSRKRRAPLGPRWLDSFRAGSPEWLQPQAPPVMAPVQRAPAAGSLEEMILWVQERRPVNTSKTYATYDGQFYRWCMEQGEQYFPASELTVARFLRYLYEVRDLAASTINGPAAAAIADGYRFTSLQSPTLGGLVKATKKVIGANARPKKKRLPLKKQHLVGMVATMPPYGYEAVRNLFLILLMFAAMLRSSEAVGLEPRDVWLDVHEGETVLYVFVDKSKTDQQRGGHTIVVGKARDQSVCPVFWYSCFLMLANHDATKLFHVVGGTRGLAPGSVSHILKDMLRLSGVQNIDIDAFTSHSCRIGGATAAAAAGVDLRLIMRHGNWKSYAVFLYIRDCMRDRLSVSKAIL